ncbi:ATP-binding protein [Xanthobacter aminoxidans]|uniref:ATP-binding protein n=1 Tax=Xanthobacter aminoxidans TaxID=186280 RepID=UPI00372BEB05
MMPEGPSQDGREAEGREPEKRDTEKPARAPRAAERRAQVAETPVLTPAPAAPLSAPSGLGASGLAASLPAMSLPAATTTAAPALTPAPLPEIAAAPTPIPDLAPTIAGAATAPPPVAAAPVPAHPSPAAAAPAPNGRSGRRRLALVGAVAAVVIGGAAAGALDPLLAILMAALLVALWLSLRPAPPAPVPVVTPLPTAPPPARDTQACAVVAALPEPALLLSAAGNIITANQRVALALGPTRVGDPLSFVVRVPEVLDAVRAAAADGVPRRVEFAERIPLDRWLEAHVVPLRLHVSPERAPDAVLLTFRDLTQQRRVEQMRADFVANASHELRTPLASLSGFIETLQGPARNDTPARERFLAIMAAQARRMSRLIDDLLSLSRIELNAHVQPQTKVDLGAIIAHVCDTLSPLARDRGVELEQVRETADLEILGDRDELIRLFENLVENALKYGAAGKKVEVRLARENGTAVVSVRDFGPGISPEHLPRLTERFYRVDVAASRDQGGTGLGLAIVKHIVARHRGRLGVESELGNGAIFSVRMDALPNPEKNL